MGPAHAQAKPLMTSLPRALALSFGQLGDPAILRVLGKTLLITLAIFAVVAVVGSFALDWLLRRAGLWVGFELTVIVNLLLTLILGWLLFRVVALAVLQFFADEVVAAVEARHYPGAAHSLRTVPFREELGHSLRGAGRALLANLLALPFALALLLTGVGTALVFWAVNAWLLGRELQDMVWLRHSTGARDEAPLRGPTRFMVGGVTAAMLMIPFVNLLAPIIGAASATHLVHRARDAHA